MIRWSAVPLCLSCVACGGAGGPGGAVAPSPTPAGPTGSVLATVYYDENADAQLDPSEVVRLPNVTVSIGPVAGKTQVASGVALVQGIPYGSQVVSIEIDSLPPYWQPAKPVTITLPDQVEVRIPVTLPVGRDAVANQYVAFGDSITLGEESSSKGSTYPAVLEATLRASMGAAFVANRGAPGTTSAEGMERVKRAVDYFKPTHVLVLYGTNDWNFPQCQTTPASACFTLGELRSIIEFIKSRGSYTLLSTLTPVSRNPDRNQWIEQMNELIKGLAREQGVALVDSYAAFRAAGDLAGLFSDDGLHPNDAGYRVLASAFAKALTSGRGAATATLAECGSAPWFFPPDIP